MLLILEALRSGLRRLRTAKRLVLVYYLVNVCFGLLIALPVWAILDQFVGRSLMGADIADRIDAHFIMELAVYIKAGMAGLVLPILFIVAIYWLASLFMSAGALAVLASGERYQPAVFWGAAGEFFGRFLRLALWSLLLLAVVSLVPLLVLGLKRLIYGPDPYEYISYWGFWIGIGLALAGLFFSCIAMDYARIQAVLTREKRMRVSLWRGIRFTLTNLGGTLGLASLLLVAGAVALAIYQPLSGGLSGPTPILVGMLFILQQLYVVWRMALRLTRYAAELELYQLRET